MNKGNIEKEAVTAVLMPAKRRQIECVSCMGEGIVVENGRSVGGAIQGAQLLRCSKGRRPITIAFRHRFAAPLSSAKVALGCVTINAMSER